MAASTYRLTVPQGLYDALADGVSQEFADSYLFGATLDGRVLTPRTECGWSRMTDRYDCRAVLKRLGIDLVRPTPFPGEGNRLTADDALYDIGEAPGRKR